MHIAFVMKLSTSIQQMNFRNLDIACYRALLELEVKFQSDSICKDRLK